MHSTAERGGTAGPGVHFSQTLWALNTGSGRAGGVGWLVDPLWPFRQLESYPLAAKRVLQQPGAATEAGGAVELSWLPRFKWF